MTLDEIKQQFRLQFGLNASEPTDSQLKAIADRCPPGATITVITDAVYSVCPSFGENKSDGGKMADPRTVLDELRIVLRG